MTPEERDLITGLFDRLQRVEGVTKDRDADGLIRDAVRQIPDAPYLLVQSVLVQEQALQQADARIRELEARVASLSSRAGEPPAGDAGRGSFLAGARGLQPRQESSVPSAGRQVANAPPSEVPPAPAYQQSSPSFGGGGGGFLSSALSTATGVTGGMLLAESIRGLFGGGHSAEGGTSAALERAQREAQTSRNDADNARKDVAADDAALDDAQDALDDSNQDDWADDGSYDA